MAKPKQSRSRRPRPRPPTPPRGIRLLYDLVGEINSGQTLDEVVAIAFDRMRRVLPYHRIALATYDAPQDELVLAAVKSDSAEGLRPGYRAHVHGSSLEPLVRKGRLRIINDLSAYARRHPDSSSTTAMLHEGTRASLTVPLALEGRPVGVLFFSSRKPRSYRPAHAALVRGIADHIAVIVEKARLADDLRATHQRLESILRDSADGILVLDMENHIVSWNKGAERIFGYSSAEVVGQPFDLLVPADLRASGELPELRNRIREKGYITNYETRRITKDRREIFVNITSTLLRDASGQPFGRSSIVRDVTALKSLQEELVRTRNLAALGEMAASVAHEIRNPLAGISGAIQVLRDGFDAQDSRRAVIGAVLDHVTRLDHTVRDLLVFSKPWKPEKRRVDVREVVDDIVATARRNPRYAAIQFATDAPVPVPVALDPLLLNEILINLFENASHAMHGVGTVRCGVTAEGACACIRIRDTGPGIPPETQRRLFTPFVTTKTTGNGLGLAICRKIMEAHGGTIDLQSAPGHGTEVALRFPLD
ncbi:MAG: PAS domain S-box protein [Lentisphaerae bacterium]|nr:PAS domain S-box protein [Lentisphaerota bacterium]